MKKCPTCNRTFSDDALSYCLQDGSALISVSADEPQSYDPGATMQYIPGRETNPPPTPAYTPPQFPGQPAQQSSWSPTPPAGGMQGQPPKKKSKAIFWVLGIVAVIAVLGIGGIVLAIVLGGFGDSNTNNSNANNSNANSNKNSNSANSNNSNANSNANSNSTPSRTDIAKDDFSVTRWWVGSNVYGKGEYVNGEYQLTGGSENGYVAVYGQSSYLSADATTRMTVRNVTGGATSQGYGLAVFGQLKGGQLDDYSFLIRTDSNAGYRIVTHGGGSEQVLTDWTPAPQIRAGSSTNQLEVRAGSSELSFYINGQFAASVKYDGRNKSGLAGVYTSGLSTIAFDDLEIFR
jgi:hypothetical protein